MTVVWLTPLGSCDTCNTPFGNGEGESRVMYDAVLTTNVWANICQHCFDHFNCQLGTGRGQRYELQIETHSPHALYQESVLWVKTGG